MSLPLYTCVPRGKCELIATEAPEIKLLKPVTSFSFSMGVLISTIKDVRAAQATFLVQRIFPRNNLVVGLTTTHLISFT